MAIFMPSGKNPSKNHHSNPLLLCFPGAELLSLIPLLLLGIPPTQDSAEISFGIPGALKSNCGNKSSKNWMGIIQRNKQLYPPLANISPASNLQRDPIGSFRGGIGPGLCHLFIRSIDLFKVCQRRIWKESRFESRSRFLSI